MRTTVVLEDETSNGTTTYRALSLEENGDVVLSGHDYGAGVEAFWGTGHDEYEFERRIGNESVGLLRGVLDIDDDDLLRALSNHTSAEIEAVLEANEIPSDLWSRVGN